MKFNNADEVELVAWQLKEAEYTRSDNRRRIDELFNGFPPYSPQEQADNNIEINVNFLESTRLAHDARSQFYNAFLKPGNYFTLRTDAGAQHKRAQRGADATRIINRLLKDSLSYTECFRSKFANNVLHGPGYAVWENGDNWEPVPVGVEDVLMPSQTLTTMRNLPFFVVCRSFTAPEIIKLTRRPNPDPGWNMELVNECIEWIDRESMALMGSNWPEIWAPEKMQERVKSDGGLYSSDQVPTIDVFDFYTWDDSGKREGWRRRMVLDNWSMPQGAGLVTSQPRMQRKTGDIYKRSGAGKFLYTSKDRVVADSWREILSATFADLSAVAPFRVHSVRSLGFLLYAICHLQNRLRCRFNEAVFESLMMYFRVKNLDDVQRALKMEMINRGFIEDGLVPLTAQERYQVNAPLVQLGLQQNQQTISENSSSWVQQPNYSQGGVEKTKFQVLAETNAMTSLVSAGLNQAYGYQKFEYLEVVRRLFQRNSRDPAVLKTRAQLMAKDIPERMLTVEAWDCEPERVMGAGNKTLEMTIAQQLMEWRQLFDPEPQRVILRDSVLAITDDPARANALVPENPNRITSGIHDGQVSAGILLQGLPVQPQDGQNQVEYIEAMLPSMAVAIKKILERGGVGTPDEIAGLQNLGMHIAERIKILAEDKNEKGRVKDYMGKLTKLMNEVRAMTQRLQEQMKQAQQAQASGNGQMDPKDQAKIQATMATAQAKMQNSRESHAQRTAQRKLQFEQQMIQKQQEHEMEMQKMRAQLHSDVAAKDLETAANIQRNRLAALNEPGEDGQ